MPATITSATRRRGNRAPRWPFTLDATHPLARNLVAWWPLLPGTTQEAAGVSPSPLIRDVGPNRLDLTLSSVGAFDIAPVGAFGGWVYPTPFMADSQLIMDLDPNDGVPTYLTGSDAPLQITGAMTVSAWIAPQGAVQNNWLGVGAGGESLATNVLWIFYSTGTTIAGFWEYGLGSNVAVAVSYTLPTEEWTHVTTIRDNGNFHVVANGVHIGSDTYTNEAAGGTSTALSIGIGDAYAQGGIADVRIWNYAMPISMAEQMYWSPSFRWGALKEGPRYDFLPAAAAPSGFSPYWARPRSAGIGIGVR